jgi:hypothetical protein
MADDVFDELSRREPEPMREEDKGRCMVVGVRAKDSAEIEARERAHFDPNPRLGEGAWWPIPFREEDGYPAKLTKAQVANLTEFFGITETEYRELVKREVRR